MIWLGPKTGKGTPGKEGKKEREVAWVCRFPSMDKMVLRLAPAFRTFFR